MEKNLIIRSGETILKGNNRRFFEEKLMKSIRRVLKPLGFNDFNLKYNSIYVPFTGQNEVKAINALMHVFGIDLVSIATQIPAEMEQIKTTALTELKNSVETTGAKTFKVQTKRTDKSFPMNSQEISYAVGEFLLHHTSGLSVDVHHPDIVIYVEVKKEAYVFSDRMRGLGGLPRETSGSAMLLLSGGIDSPVAGWMVAKRGVTIKAVHFHSYPYTSQQAKDKVKDLASIVSKYSGPIHLFSINLLPFQIAVKENCPEDEGTIIIRRMMTRLGEALALKNGCDALITGEALGQVASQTIQSLRVTNESVTLPILRPLIAMDKYQIIEMAKKINTYETSILPYEDCCTVFLPRRPVTKPRIHRIHMSESLIDMDYYQQLLLEGVEEEWIKVPLEEIGS